MSDPFYRSQAWRTLRATALKRDNYRCIVKGCNVTATHVDHIISRRAGGPDALANLRSLCPHHDAQVKERPSGQRARKGQFKLLGCSPDGWPLSRQG